MTLAAAGEPWARIEEQLNSLKALDYRWEDGRLPSYVYFYSEEALEVQRRAYDAFIVENGLGEGKAFKSLSFLVQDVMRMSEPLFHTPRGGGSSFLSGGTESLFMAMKAARDYARSNRKGAIKKPNVVAPTSAHPAINKAGLLMDIDIRRVPVGPDFRADVQAIEDQIDEDTLMIVASAPCFPYGVFDPIEELGSLAERTGVWLHVDGCWGGFLSPFCERLGYSIPRWDFRVPGVSSLSADIHKFGYGAKGASLLVFRDAALRAFHHFSHEWVRGVYESSSFAGSKPGGSVAAAWAVMKFMGIEGYLDAARITMATTHKLMDGIERIEGLKLGVTQRESNLIFFQSESADVDINAVAEAFGRRGWFVGRIKQPLGIHQGVNPVHAKIADKYIEELRDAVAEVRLSSARAIFDDRSY